jgi:hypothetical protein
MKRMTLAGSVRGHAGPLWASVSAIDHHIAIPPLFTEDVHFNPWYSNAQPYMSWQVLYGRAFVMGRSDWEYVFNT